MPNRQRLVAKVYRLTDQPSDDLSETTTAQERLAMVWPLTVEAWSLTGVAIPDYDRRDVPIRIKRVRSAHPQRDRR